MRIVFWCSLRHPGNACSKNCLKTLRLHHSNITKRGGCKRWLDRLMSECDIKLTITTTARQIQIRVAMLMRSALRNLIWLNECMNLFRSKLMETHFDHERLLSNNNKGRMSRIEDRVYRVRATMRVIIKRDWRTMSGWDISGAEMSHFMTFHHGIWE